VQDRHVELLRCRCDEQVGDLALAPAALGEQALRLQSANQMRRRRLDPLERAERADEAIHSSALRAE